MALVKLVSFDRPLAGAVLPGQPGPMYTETAGRGEDPGRRPAGRRRRPRGGGPADGGNAGGHGEPERGRPQAARRHAPRPCSGSCARRSPGLALEIARRLLAGFEPPPEIIERFCREALDQLFPEREGLELALCPRDAEQLARLSPDWLQRYPGLRVRTDASLSPGDCLVSSRFGLTDGRRVTKLAALEHSLVGA